MPKHVLLKVKKIVPHQDGEHLTFQDAFLYAPSELFDKALKEKKACLRPEWYALRYKLKMLERHQQLFDFIANVVGRFDEQCIERIKIVNVPE